VLYPLISSLISSPSISIDGSDSPVFAVDYAAASDPRQLLSLVFAIYGLRLVHCLINAKCTIVFHAIPNPPNTNSGRLCTLHACTRVAAVPCLIDNFNLQLSPSPSQRHLIKSATRHTDSRASAAFLTGSPNCVYRSTLDSYREPLTRAPETGHRISIFQFSNFHAYLQSCQQEADLRPIADIKQHRLLTTSHHRRRTDTSLV
jgi:hypothetical protein